MRRYGMPPERATWVRVVAAVTAASLGYSALTLVAAPGWAGWLLLVGAVGLLVGLLARGPGDR